MKSSKLLQSNVLGINKLVSHGLLSTEAAMLAISIHIKVLEKNLNGEACVAIPAKTICDYLGVKSNVTAYKYIKECEAANLIHKTERKGLANHYGIGLDFNADDYIDVMGATVL